MQPLDKGVDFRPLAARQGGHIVVLVAFQRHIAERGDQLPLSSRFCTSRLRPIATPT